MLQLINTSTPDNISALLTSACVSSTYEVESTKDIVEMWKKIKGNINLKEDIDFISAILCTGRIMHGTSEMKDPEKIMDMIETFKNEINRKTETTIYNQNDYCAALMSAAFVSRSTKIVSAKDIIQLWGDIKNKIKIADDYDLISTILTSSRIADMRFQTDNLIAVGDTFENVKNAVNKKVSNVNMTVRELATAYIAAACIEITPKVEKIRDMIGAWQSINEQLTIKNNDEYVAAILTAGRIKDLDAQHFMIPESINDIHAKILEYMIE